MSGDELGILSCGSYLPRQRLPSSLVASSHGWFDPALGRGAEHRRSFCNWDEDAVTMAVESARVPLEAAGHPVGQLSLASTSLPFADRSNAGIVREALDLGDDTIVADCGGSTRAGSTALLAALEASGTRGRLVIASDCVDTQPASPQESAQGHGAAAFVVGRGEPIATLEGAASLHQDFVDHYRAAGERFAYTLEARWTRDAGYRRQVEDVYRRALANAGVEHDAVDRVSIAAPPALSKALQKTLGVEDDIGDAIGRHVGYCGSAHASILLAAALESASPGDTLVVVSIGQGVDAMVFSVHRAIHACATLGAARAGVDETNYCRYLALRRLLSLDKGIRAERDNRTAQSAAWRKHESVNAFKGGLCSACETLQFPESRVCVACGGKDTQVATRMAETIGTVRSFTEDWLASTPKPPLMFGNVGFENGANVMMEFTDVDAGELHVGMPVRMVFRIKDFDERRQFRRYFWKPVPLREQADG